MHGLSGASAFPAAPEVSVSDIKTFSGSVRGLSCLLDEWVGKDRAGKAASVVQ